MSDEYTPIKTRADRRAERVEAVKEGIKDHIVHRFIPEVGEMLGHKMAQGADEFANMLFSGSGYLPWPGPSTLQVHEIPEPADGNATPMSPIVDDGSLVQLDGYEPKRAVHDHNSLYVSGADPGPIAPDKREVNLNGAPPPRPQNHTDLYTSGRDDGPSKIEPPSIKRDDAPTERTHRSLYLTEDVIDQSRLRRRDDDGRGMSR